ncbi:MAG: lytic transglycosylase domain-containing protein [Taibaiella sp.]|nr:lytic transglycosylase domain-containing protein [Taibaiella sp.]
MQCKVLLTSVIITLSAVSASAQQKNVKPVKTDSTTGKIVPKTGGGLLASNTPTAKPDSKQPYNHVPLAGEKAYFGDKDEYVNEYVRKYMETNNRTLSSVQNNSATPFSVIDNILEQKNMPKELKYLAVIESALNHNAVSRAGAVGPWQMMETTAKMMGLSVSRKKDERTDLAKSTTAATKYLNLLYGQLNDWLLVIAAYNSGPRPVQKAIEKTGSHNFWDIKEYLPHETQGHVLAFIATASIFENLSKFISLGSIPVDFKFGKDKDDDAPAIPAALLKEIAAASAAVKAGTPVGVLPAATAAAATVARPSFTDDELKNMSIVKIDKPIAFEVIEHELGVDKKMLNRWNPDYDLFITNKSGVPFYKLRFPKDKIDLFLQKKEVLGKMSKSFLEQQGRR